jgi:4'-phosphopantetheinyl transferase EntD
VQSSDHAGNALYIVWRFRGAREHSTARARKLLNHGQKLHLYRLHSWVAVNGEIRALVAPAAPVEEIAAAARKERCETVSTRWVATERACTNLVREIETAPVHLGLASRPEEWPFSSAANDYPAFDFAFPACDH